MIRSTLRVVLASLICSSLLPAQRGTARSLAPEEGGMLQVEALTLPSAEPGKARVDVLYRIPRRFFVFVRPEPVTQAAAFVARAEIAVELFDPGDRSAARDYTVRELSASAPQEGADGSEVGQSSFIVPPGAYTLFMEVRDRESNRVAQSRTPLTVPAPRDTTFASGILLCAPAAGTDVVPLNHGGDIPLGARADAWFLVASADTFSSCSAAYRLTRSPSEELDSATAGADSI